MNRFTSLPFCKRYRRMADLIAIKLTFPRTGLPPTSILSNGYFV
jgi:hypothetical protein